ncbi:BTB/POZ domain-containing protein KCTD16-like [Hemicordylus capensis]|uniref:BTB/POZ domain-containing protein KCTD16-like n=1 Tax=Hemicordylus capensis TaxID=884348 RepID=UPI002303E9C9|nr:BTB/POZ domain-containing protein KCTD16-like [Hemicordylus capensis]
MECAPVAAVESSPIVTTVSAPVTTQGACRSPEACKDPSSDLSTGGCCDPDMVLPPPPDKGPPSEAGSLASLPWPEAPEECGPQRPNTLDLSKPLKKLEEVKQAGQRRNSDHTSIKENGFESCPAAVPRVSEERRALQSELGKCIADFQKIKIPVSFPNKKRQWQHELLKKYQL